MLILCLLAARPLAAQDTAASPSVATVDDFQRWEPLGSIPVDQAGAGRRGYVLPGESADVTASGASQVSFHSVAANNFYREETGDFLVSQRYETHTLAIGYRRGFKGGLFPRVEFGAQVQLHESDNGILNGFISGFENSWVSLTGSQTAKNQLRASDATLPPLGTSVTRDGQSIYRAPGNGSGVGDMYFVAKALLHEGSAASGDAQLAARVALNVSGRWQFTEGNFAGVGLSLDKKVLEGLAFHGDVRANFFLDRVSQWGLPLKRGSWAFSAGPEVKLAANTSLSLQIDGSTTPYLPTGTAAFDKDYGDVTFGLGHRFRAGDRRIIAQLYVRENMNLPFYVRWNTDPDMSLGLKVTIR